MKTRIIITFIMTLAVIIGGWLYYDNVMNEPKGPGAYYVQNDIQVVNAPFETPSVNQVVSDVKLPKYKPSSRSVASSSGNEFDLSRAANMSSSKTKRVSAQGIVGGNSYRYQANKSDIETEKYYSTNANGLLAYRSGVSSMRSTGSSYAESSSAVTSMTTPMLIQAAQLSAPFTAANGYVDTTSDGDDTDDGLPPPVGNPVGEGFWILLVLVGAYLFYRRKL